MRGKVVAQNEAARAVYLKGVLGRTEKEEMAKRKRDGNGLFVFARVRREWRKAQLEV